MGWLNFTIYLHQATLRWQHSVRGIFWEISSTWVSVKEFKAELCFSFAAPQFPTIVLENLLSQIYQKSIFMQHPHSFHDIDFMPILQMLGSLMGLKLCMTRIYHRYLIAMKKIISNSGLNNDSNILTTSSLNLEDFSFSVKKKKSFSLPWEKLEKISLKWHWKPDKLVQYHLCKDR